MFTSADASYIFDYLYLSHVIYKKLSFTLNISVAHLTTADVTNA